MRNEIRDGKVDSGLPQRLEYLLELLYGVNSDDLLTKLRAAAANHTDRTDPGWSEQDTWLITYPDQFQEPGVSPLKTLERIYLTHLSKDLNGVHVLPCYPWTSDDGYAVTDYHAIDSNFGTWHDIEALSTKTRLMLDAVINHMSSSSDWFRRQLNGDPAYAGFFRTASPEADLAQTVRPRATPLLTPFEGAAGREWVWTTFSADQVDLDFRNPRVFLAVVEVLLEYARRGARMIRLDAVQFLGKREGTTSINLPEAHSIVEALRLALDLAYPGVLLVSESNVPHEENLAYLGDAEHRKAQIVYQFALAPLILHTMVMGDATALQTWARRLPSLAEGTTVLNYLASHDGVAVRPVENILSVDEVDRLVRHTEAAGGGVNVRALPDGRTSPYELASTWYELMASGFDEEAALARHVASHAIMLAMQGIPAIYVHSLFGTPNDRTLADETGMARSLNRHKFVDVSVLEQALADGTSRPARTLAGLVALLRRRRSDPEFHPDVGQEILDTGPGVFALQRGSAARVFVNVTGEPQVISTEGWALEDGTAPDRLGPWESLWLARAKH